MSQTQPAHETVELHTELLFGPNKDRTAVICRFLFNDKTVVIGVLNASIWTHYPVIREEWIGVMKQAAHAAVTDAANDMGATVVESTGYQDVPV